MKRIWLFLFLILVCPHVLWSQTSQFGNDFVLAGATCPPVNPPAHVGTLYTCTGTGALYTWTGSAWVAAGGASGAPTDATYITQTPNGSLSAEQALSALSTGMARVTTTTGVVTSLTDAQSYYNVLVNGIVAGDVDTAGANSTAFLALLATVNTAGGGIIYFPPGTYRFDSQILLPNDGASPQPNQNNIRLTGAGSGGSWYGINSTILDLRYTAVDGNAKIESRGKGTLMIDHLEISDGGASNATPMIHSTNTTLHIYDNTFLGSGNTGQDAIYLGGTSTTLSGLVAAPFQGYNTRIIGNQFRNLQRGLYGLNYVNAVVFSNNSFLANVGTVAVELDGLNAAGQYDYGNSFVDNTFEMNIYIHAFKLTWARNNTFIGNHMFDGDADVTGYYDLGVNGYRNIIMCGATDPLTIPTLSGDTTSKLTTTAICPDNTPEPISSNGPISSSIAYGLAVTGTYDSTKNYPGSLIAADQFSPNQRVSIGYDAGAANEGIIDVRNAGSGTRPLNIISSTVKANNVTVTETAGQSGLTLTGATQTTSFPVISATQTWNAGAVQFFGEVFNYTSTASLATSSFVDYKIGGSSLARIQKDGSFWVNAATGTTQGAGFYGPNGGNVHLGSINGTAYLGNLSNFGGSARVDGSLIKIPSGSTYSWSADTTSFGTTDVSLARDAANTLAQRNSTSAQAFNIYSTYTSATNNEYFNALWSSSVLHLGTNKGSGGGTARVMQLDYGGTTTSAISVPITSGTVTFGGSTTANYYIGNGSGLTVADVGASSCGTTAATVAGGSSSFEVTVGATSGTQCRVAFPTAAPTRWNCAPSNTSTAALVRAANVDTTHVDLLGVFTAGDVISAVCVPR